MAAPPLGMVCMRTFLNRMPAMALVELMAGMVVEVAGEAAEEGHHSVPEHRLPMPQQDQRMLEDQGPTTVEEDVVAIEGFILIPETTNLPAYSRLSWSSNIIIIGRRFAGFGSASNEILEAGFGVSAA